MTKYVKFNESGDCTGEAPKQMIKDDVIIIGYNTPSNEEMLLADGYLRYDGTKDWKHLKLVNGEIVEINDPIAKPTVFTKLQIRRAMRKLQMEDQLNEVISSNFQVQSDWNDAQVISLNDPVFKEALSNYGIDDAHIQVIIDNIEEQ